MFKHRSCKPGGRTLQGETKGSNRPVGTLVQTSSVRLLSVESAVPQLPVHPGRCQSEGSVGSKCVGILQYIEN